MKKLVKKTKNVKKTAAVCLYQYDNEYCRNKHCRNGNCIGEIVIDLIC
ncbi:MAG: hypothetical protein J5898_11175 [Lachnospiraceae bacterium]|nr:hypothetical protein [Lachnospiraceae bacterium]